VLVSTEGLMSICPTCGSVHEDNAALKETLTKQAKEIAGLKRALTEAHRSGPLMDEIREVFDHWVRRLGKRENTVLGKQRVEAVRARLKEGFTVERLKRAIDGCATDDWAMGRVRKSNGKTYNDLGKHICVSDEAVERFEQMTEKATNVVQLRPRARQPMFDPLARPLDRALIALRREFGSDSVTTLCAELNRAGRYDEWWSVCPVQPGLGQPMRIRESGGVPGGSLDLACAHGCLPSVLAEAIRGLEAKRDEAKVPVAERLVTPGAIRR
jgi:hypothetical protein